MKNTLLFSLPIAVFACVHDNKTKIHKRNNEKMLSGTGVEVQNNKRRRIDINEIKTGNFASLGGLCGTPNSTCVPELKYYTPLKEILGCLGFVSFYLAVGRLQDREDICEFVDNYLKQHFSFKEIIETSFLDADSIHFSFLNGDNFSGGVLYDIIDGGGEINETNKFFELMYFSSIMVSPFSCFFLFESDKPLARGGMFFVEQFNVFFCGLFFDDGISPGERKQCFTKFNRSINKINEILKVTPLNETKPTPWNPTFWFFSNCSREDIVADLPFFKKYPIEDISVINGLKFFEGGPGFSFEKGEVLICEANEKPS